MIIIISQGLRQVECPNISEEKGQDAPKLQGSLVPIEQSMLVKLCRAQRSRGRGIASQNFMEMTWAPKWRLNQSKAVSGAKALRYGRFVVVCVRI